MLSKLCNAAGKTPSPLLFFLRQNGTELLLRSIGCLLNLKLPFRRDCTPHLSARARELCWCQIKCDYEPPNLLNLPSDWPGSVSSGAKSLVITLSVGKWEKGNCDSRRRNWRCLPRWAGRPVWISITLIYLVHWVESGGQILNQTMNDRLGYSISMHMERDAQ